MKYLIYELFSGVGFCNQLFSFETAIYLSNLLNRKLILIVKNPLCHCGSSSWNNGMFLEFFSNDYLEFLENGIEVYYKTIPENILNIINSEMDCLKLDFKDKFSSFVFVDKDLDTIDNQQKIKNFCNFRDKYVFDIETLVSKYIYIEHSNASRCFYNFYTNKKNYKLMNNICESLTNLNNIFSKIDIKLPKKYIAIHLRLGDKKHNKEHIDNLSMKYYNFLKTLINNILTEIKNKNEDCVNIYLMSDRKDGNIIDLLKSEFNIILTDELLLKLDYKKKFLNLESYNIVDFLIQKNICQNAAYFIGNEGSTVSNYIQYIRMINKKEYYYYNSRDLILVKQMNDYFNWNYNYRCDGASISWKLFFPENIMLNHIKFITLTNDGYKELTQNLLISMKKIGIESTLTIYCIGEDSYQFFSNNYPHNEVILLDCKLIYLKNWIPYRSIQNQDILGKQKWAELTSYKILCMNNELKKNNDIVFIDGDIVFCRNPLFYLLKNIKNYDLLIQNDNSSYLKRQFCTGFFFMRSNKKTIDITNYNEITKDLNKFQNDQQFLRIFENQLNVSYLPLDLFPNGMYWRTYQPNNPYLIHFNYDTSYDKVKRMKIYNKWYIDNKDNSYYKFKLNNSYFYQNKISFQDWIQFKIDPKDIIINCSNKDGSDGFIDYPIGVQHDYLKFYFNSNYNNFINHFKINTELCLCSMSSNTDKGRRGNKEINRKKIMSILSTKKCINFFKESSINYFNEISKYKFVICPEGNGIDTHRLWETLYSKGIPIVEKNDLMFNKLKDLPILWTTDYSEITEEYLENKYKEISQKTYHFEKLFLTKYSDKCIEEINDFSYYWCNKRNLQEEINKYHNINKIELDNDNTMKNNVKIDNYNKDNHNKDNENNANIDNENNANIDNENNINIDNEKYINYNFWGLKDGNGVQLDKKIDELFKSKESGIFIDVGAFDGVKYSNTYFLEKYRNWNGILITPNQQLYEKCLLNRPNSISSCYACVSPFHRESTIKGDFWRLSGSINCFRSKSKNNESVPCITLTKLLNNLSESFYKKYHKNLKKEIDLLKIDTGAFEYDVLLGIDLKLYNIKYILVEILIDLEYESILNYMVKNDYKLLCNFSNFNKKNKLNWDGSHNDYLFVKI